MNNIGLNFCVFKPAAAVRWVELRNMLCVKNGAKFTDIYAHVNLLNKVTFTCTAVFKLNPISFIPIVGHKFLLHAHYLCPLILLSGISISFRLTTTFFSQ